MLSMYNKQISGQILVVLFAHLIVMGFKLLFDCFPDLEILWPAHSAVHDKGQRRDSSSTEGRF